MSITSSAKSPNARGMSWESGLESHDETTLFRRAMFVSTETPSGASGIGALISDIDSSMHLLRTLSKDLPPLSGVYPSSILSRALSSSAFQVLRTMCLACTSMCASVISGVFDPSCLPLRDRKALKSSAHSGTLPNTRSSRPSR